MNDPGQGAPQSRPASVPGPDADGDALGTETDALLENEAREEEEAEAEAEAQAALAVAAGATPLDPVAMDLLERVGAVNARFPGPEAQKFSVRAEADKVIAEYDAMEARPGELTLAVVKLLRHMRKYQDALKVLEQRSETPGAKAREFLFLEMVLSFACRQEARALDLLTRLEASGKLRPSWKRSIATMRTRFGRSGARKGVKEMEAAMRALERVPDVATWLPVVKSRYASGNTALELLVFARDRMQELHAVTAPTQASGLAVFDKYHRAKLIFTCGFGWSGSGAVTCFLHQHREVELPFGMSELGYVQGKAGKDGLFSVLRKVPCSFHEMKKMLAYALVSSIFCLSSSGYNGPLKSSLSGENGRVTVLGRLLDDFVRLMLSADALADLDTRSRILGRFLECLLSIRGGSTIVLNNVLMASKIELMPFMDNSSFVVVQRDVRDQFTARSLECNDMHRLGLDVASFHRFVGDNRAKFELARAGAVRRGAEGKMLFIKFEDFIREEQQRLQVLEFLGLDPAGIVPDTKKFDPSVSVKNIGIHLAKATPEDVAYLEREMGIYLSQSMAPAATPAAS